MTYRIDWIVPQESAGLPMQKGSETFATEQEARAQKAIIRATKPGAIITGPYRVQYLGVFQK